MASTEQIKQLREETGVSVIQCKKALEEAEGDFEKAREVLKRKGAEAASKKADRTLGSGVIASYVHSDNRLGVLVELLSETDFVARNEEFKALGDDIAMHIAAMNPDYVRSEDVSEEVRAELREAFAKEVAEMDKPEEVKERILESKLATHIGERTLMSQAFVKDPNTTIEQLLEAATQKFGEKIQLTRFTRFALLEE